MYMIDEYKKLYIYDKRYVYVCTLCIQEVVNLSHKGVYRTTPRSCGVVPIVDKFYYNN